LTQQKASRVVVGIADLKLSNKPSDEIVTYALGSCLGVCIYDPVAKVGGLLHAMLPSATADKDVGKNQPAKFVDSGVTALFKEAYQLGAKKEQIVVKVAGGASVANGGEMDSFQIGKRNIMALKKIFWKNGVLIKAEDVGGSKSRTVTLDIATGEVRIKSQGADSAL
jgi:chemotaxis protein CheD